MAGPNPQVQYTMQLHSRALVPVTGQRSKSQWLVGSTALREENEVRLLEYDSDQEVLRSAAAWLHPDEVAAPRSASSRAAAGTQPGKKRPRAAADAAACCGGLPDIVTRAPARAPPLARAAGKYGATLWQAEPGSHQLRELAGMEHTGVVRRALWNRLAPDMLITLEEGALRKWQMGAADAQCVASGPPGDGRQLWGGAVHPKNAGLAAAVAGSSVQIWDIQNCCKVGEVPGAHRLPARDVDWAPHNEHRLVTCGDDCRLRFWDTRALGRAEPLLELSGHSHWAWAARFSPFHDQLLASSSSDCTVSLWYTPVLARQRDAPGETGARVVPSRGDADGRVVTWDEEHEDSVYGLAWSAADPWVLASMSYDGRIVVNHVPKNLKYKILV
ncbi:tumor suppressing subtransferable candidate 1 [Monoraphidium neglectum]|uniref:Tumor suppressing subtransferable candidate 1 n=1 Tax=Monoraphidium neglectum TaxID=145388 RepID=A0A0D2LGR4_9CHLO|nr:tumor suppressing subtransferable candidate 1 [Monoraphidium neglectum]KIZ05664.1 tumor suppressing subtransferable candidate 1 [Monoraphidium neglectum]|eukprot:XP_013904683.1 tumor suppressing subtransferable candidate 1 [Monoraphidium neglectum]